ncbi:peptide chain release factor N(5)-glutamine methyltransferase [Salipaludibacillus agaradhaerens]|jgi:release factor glutamine methyltransferase|uniref:peptide chain release factor N(5)-glutamine methyltransferase n=1 Tax=Salipaludibacillus agaradhaerens TaxID=76935 RepID=UPI002151F313|nr:peptide chain release factor N(5)-glutamine methyltransferase [Salipaludibacillus agaradhaerens]MCR6108245.1 peptide chain release factor N(5)-glutamine methyltransferase [Salipaludibacillus agaradhaerens]MCR6120270.1 peptide chain release factor N(5)-glutamine methyltransferase [Salipaludibacillus agaradhaerens]UJW59286.1 peptide chain release factor N(5)-glutamine methyltransferase [Bacillus sp. A116_S68]
MSLPTTTKTYEALNWASSFLQQHNYEGTIGHILLMHHTGWSRTRMLTEQQTVLSSDLFAAFQHDVRRAASGIPVQHITGKETFYDRHYHVNNHVLIPRPETEELVETLLTTLDNHKHLFNKNEEEPLTIVDVGTGSGIIAITMALEVPSSHVSASDISAEALAVAKRNADSLEARVEFLHGDLLLPFIEKSYQADVIISNPPYIPIGDKEWMKGNVKDHEPSGALFAGEDGLEIYRRLVHQIPLVLSHPGIIAFEIGYNQGDAVTELLQQVLPLDSYIEVINDINGNERIVLAIVP